MKKNDKTNVMRVLDSKNIPYKFFTYQPDVTLTGEEIAGDEKYDYLDKDAGKLIGVYCGKEAEKLLLKKEEEPMSSIREDFEKMMAEEREEGREEGRKAAAEEIKAAKEETATARREAAAAKADGIKGMVMDDLEENVPRERVVLKLKKYFAISQEEAENYTLKYGYKTA